jgi:vitamin B12 transporter
MVVMGALALGVAAARAAADDRGAGRGSDVAAADERRAGADVDTAAQPLGTKAGAAQPGGSGVALARGEEPLGTIVITATRTAQPLEETTTSITVIDQEEIAKQQAVTVTEVLRNVPGVDVLQSGSLGTNTEIFIRGAEADETLVMIDGVEVNSVTLGAFDFGGLTTDNVERIEILRGGSGGTLYGSQAVGGVVNIITREGRGKPGVSLLGAGGSGWTGRGQVASSGQVGRLRYSLAGAYLGTQGFRPENDDYRNGTASLRLDYDVTEKATARFFFRYTDAEIGLFNSNNFLSKPDPNARQRDEFLTVKGEWQQEVIPNLELRLAASYARDDQHFDDPPDPAETSFTTSHIPTGIVTGEVQANHYWRQIATTTAGVEVEERMADVHTATIDPAFELRSRFDEQRRNIAGYFQEQLRLLDGRVVGVGGVRVDGNQDFGTAVSPAGSVSAALPGVPGTRLKAGYFESFKAPTFNELFFPDFGNPDLDAETSREYNVGVLGGWWAQRVVLEVTGFDRKTKNLIEGTVQEDGTFRAENRGEAHVRGVEVAPRVVVGTDPALTIGASYTRLIRVDTPPLLRRPKQRAALTVDLAGRDLGRPRTRYDVNLNAHVVGDRPDVDPAANFAFKENPAYTKVDLAGSYTFEGVLPGKGDLTLFAKIENLFDAEYDEALGFRAPPLNVLAGLRAAF